MSALEISRVTLVSSVFFKKKKKNKERNQAVDHSIYSTRNNLYISLKD